MMMTERRMEKGNAERQETAETDTVVGWKREKRTREGQAAAANIGQAMKVAGTVYASASSAAEASNDDWH